MEVDILPALKDGIPSTGARCPERAERFTAAFTSRSCSQPRTADPCLIRVCDTFQPLQASRRTQKLNLGGVRLVHFLVPGPVRNRLVAGMSRKDDQPASRTDFAMLVCKVRQRTLPTAM